MKPILFNADMVRAILDGRKTVTRRIVKAPVLSKVEQPKKVTLKNGVANFEWNTPKTAGGFEIKTPYQPGDILWVQETWKILDALNELSMKFEYRADGKISGFIDFIAERMEKFRKFANKNGWQSPYFMPKEAARIWLKVKDVRVERLQDITEEQSKAEGAIDNRGFIHSPDNEYDNIHTAKEHFEQIWNSTIKKSDLERYGWDANPWVWVIEFDRCEKPEDGR